jgi:hypothetical protein
VRGQIAFVGMLLRVIIGALAVAVLSTEIASRVRCARWR